MVNNRSIIKRIHREIDCFIAKNLSNQRPFGKKDHSQVRHLNFEDYQSMIYSRIDHFSFFHTLDVYKHLNPAICDLKVYQDLFVYSCITDIVKPGATILEIGGGHSRIIDALHGKYEFWNLDKFEGQGHGPKYVSTERNYHLVQDNIGNFSDDLPENYFDLVFSISVVEHFPQDANYLRKIEDDIKRVSKKDSYFLHCIDTLLFDDHIWFHPFLNNLQKNIPHFDFPNIIDIIQNDSKLWVMSKYAYYTRWFQKTKLPYRRFGSPFSINLFWKNNPS